MSYIIIIFYIVVLAIILTKIKWISNAGFGKKFMVLVFLAKCMAGFAYNFIAYRFIPNHGDIWPFFEDGLNMYHGFLQAPSTFFSTYFQTLHGHGDALGSNSAFVRSAFEIIKLLHFVLNFITFGNLQANTVIFNFFSVLCMVKCWRFFKEQWGNTGLLAGVIFFFLPSMFFYSAGILKEGLQICLIGLLIPSTHALVTKFCAKTFFKWLVPFVFLFIIKFFVGFSWLAVTVLWAALVRFPSAKKWVLVGFVFVAITIFSVSKYISPVLDMPSFVAKKQQEFLALPAASAIPVKVVTDDPISFASALPSALNNVLFKPLPGEGGKTMYLAFTAELLLFWGLVIFFMVKKNWKWPPDQVLNPALVLLIFAMVNLLVIGYTVPNVGAILRYRSIFMPCIALFFLCISSLPNNSVGEKLNRLLAW